MVTGYCVKCKTKRTMKGAAATKTKKGTKAVKGKCSTCGTGMFKFGS